LMTTTMTTIRVAVANVARISSQRKGHSFPDRREAGSLPPLALHVSLQLAGNRRASQFRRQPWDAAGHVDQRPVRGSHGKNPAPPLWYDLSARLHDIHLCRASNLGEIRATIPPNNTDTFLEPPPFKAARGEAVLAQPCRKADKGALVNESSKGLLVGIVRHPLCSIPWEHPGLPATCSLGATSASTKSLPD
jgi:hypothetical protein